MNHEHSIDGHTLILLRNGSDYFPRLVAALDGATHSVYLETYIYAADASGRLIANALRRAAGRGVKVHLMLDGYGSAELPQAWVQEFRMAGVEVLWFRPQISWLTLRRQRLRRLHRKLACVDGSVAFIGGINIIDDVPGGKVSEPRLDYAVEVRGETVERIHAAMWRLWMLVLWTNFRRQHEHAKLPRGPSHPPSGEVSFLVRDNLRHRRDIEQAYLAAIAAARHEIIIANAYFLPGLRFRHALLDAARRGVRVVLMLQGRVDHPLQHYATRSLYDELLGAGVEIHEYHASFMHAKVAVVDGDWATVGSSNIDPFSLWLAREANLAVHDAGFAAALRTSLLHEMVWGARLVVPAVWRSQGIWMRMLARASYGMVRVLTGLIGFARGQDDV
jgi:cardiolipin synthase A/B